MRLQGSNQFTQQPNYVPPQGPVKECKYCKVMILKTAKICPNCKKRQSKAMFWILLIIMILLLYSFISSSASRDSAPPKAVASVSESSGSDKAYSTVES